MPVDGCRFDGHLPMVPSRINHQESATANQGPAKTNTGFCGKGFPPFAGVLALGGAAMSSTAMSSEVRMIAVLPASHLATNTLVLSADAAAEKRKRTPPGTPPGIHRPLFSQPASFGPSISTT